jgi:hypothetical protein
MKKSHVVATSTLVSAGLALSRASYAGDTPAAGVTENYASNQGPLLGFSLQRFQDDFGLAGLLASPTFANDHMRLKLGGGVAFYPYAANAQNEQEWANYGHVRLVFEGGLRPSGSPIRLYGFGGPIVYVMPDRLAGTTAAFGGIGGFGFEYYFMVRGGDRDGPISYFVELGGVGVGAKADHLPGKPVVGTGFSIATGFHWYL